MIALNRQGAAKFYPLRLEALHTAATRVSTADSDVLATLYQVAQWHAPLAVCYVCTLEPKGTTTMTDTTLAAASTLNTNTHSAPVAAPAQETIQNNQKKEQRFPVVSPGDTFRQGDVWYVALDEEPKSLGRLDLTGNNQLAPGNTQGSRHTLRPGSGAEIHAVDPADALRLVKKVCPRFQGTLEGETICFPGPFVKVRRGAEVAYDHVEHDDFVVEDTSDICGHQIIYQRTMNRVSNEIARVQD